MQKLLFIGLFATLLFSFFSPKEVGTLKAKVDNIAASYLRDPENTGLSIGIIYEGKEYNFNYGYTSKLTLKPVTPNTVYEIGSITKVFTGILLANEIVDKRLELNSKLSAFYKISNPFLETIDLKSLATHSSRLPRLADNFWSSVKNDNDPYISYTKSHLVSYLAQAKPVSTIPTYLYSNTGMSILGDILCTKYNRNYESLVRDSICTPCGLENTSAQIKSYLPKVLATGYSKGQEVSPWNFLDVTAAQGALRSNILDMNQFMYANLYPEKFPYLSEAIILSQRQFFTDSIHNISMGLGWHLGKLHEEKSLNHTGGTGGFISFIGILPNSKIGVTILSNSTNDVSSLGLKILKAIKAHHTSS